MSFGDVASSTPSVAGFLLTSGACFLIPAAIPLALIQGMVINDPAQLSSLANKYGKLAMDAASAHADIETAVKDHVTTEHKANPTAWTGADADAFTETHVTPYLNAIDNTSELLKGHSSSMNVAFYIYQGVGLLSLAIGTAMALAAAAVAGVSWIPGVNVAAETEGTVQAQVSNGILRRILVRIGQSLEKLGRTLKAISEQMKTLKFVKPMFQSVKFAAGPGSLLLTGNYMAGQMSSGQPDTSDGWVGLPDNATTTDPPAGTTTPAGTTPGK